MRRNQSMIARVLTAGIASIMASCQPSSPAKEKPAVAEAAPAAEEPPEQPGSAASAASVPANHRTSKDPIELEELFRMPDSPTDVVLKVDGREVKRDALEVQLRQIQIELSATGNPGQLTRFEVLNGAAERLIDLEIRRLVGEELKVKVDPKDVKAWLADLEQRTKDDPKFEAFLLQAGRDKEARKKDAYQAVLMDGIIRKLQGKAQDHLRKEAEAYYDRHKRDYFEHAGREVWRMTLKAPRSMVQRDRDLTKEQAKGIWARARKNPKNFVNLAKSYSQDGKASDGGYLGYVSKGTLVKEVEDQIWAAKTGTVLPMRDVPVGFHIYKVGKTRKERQIPFAEVEEKIVRTIYAAAMRKMVDSELKKMREAKKVEILVPELAALRAEEDKRQKAFQERLKSGPVSHTPSRPK